MNLVHLFHLLLDNVCVYFHDHLWPTYLVIKVTFLAYVHTINHHANVQKMIESTSWQRTHDSIGQSYMQLKGLLVEISGHHIHIHIHTTEAR